MNTVLLLILLILLTSSSLLVLVLLRLRTILSRPKPTPKKRRGKHAHLCIVLGSGGHTAEMLSMLRRSGIAWRDFSHRTWIVSSGDALSAARAKEFEEEQTPAQGEKKGGLGNYRIETVPRAREIHQPLYTAPFSCLRCAWQCVRVLRCKEGMYGYPDVILCNGPATATIVVLTGVAMRFLGFGQKEGKMRTVYVESWARVKKASLSGMLLAREVERFVVQWPQMEEVMGRRTEFGGVLVG